MPEGHTIRRLARDLKTAFGGERLEVSSPQGRFASDAALVDGLELRRTDAYGKHLFLGLDDLWVHVHLGLYGKLAIRPRPEPAPFGALRMRMVGEQAYADLRGPTACEVVDTAAKRAIQARLGADPLRATESDVEALYEKVARSAVPIGTLLLQQDVIAGVGNVYRAEVLFRHGVNPFRLSRDVDPSTWHAIWADLQMLLRAGVRANRIVTTEPADRSRRSGRPTRADSFYVYGRAGEPCRRCGTPIADGVLAARRIVWCPTCQPAG